MRALCKGGKLRLLRRFYSEGDAETLSAKMRRKGILTHVSSKQSRSLSSVNTGAFTSEVWVVLSSQYEDAFALMHSRRYSVKNPLTEEEMLQLEKLASEAASKSFNTMVAWSFIALALAGVTAFAVAVFTGVLGSA